MVIYRGDRKTSSHPGRDGNIVGKNLATLGGLPYPFMFEENLTNTGIAPSLGGDEIPKADMDVDIFMKSKVDHYQPAVGRMTITNQVVERRTMPFHLFYHNPAC